jgi:CRP/FNR family transcriptional regulator, cyclic AMP receptor protein
MATRALPQSQRRVRRRPPHATATPASCHVLLEDPSLSGSLSGARLVAAQRACVAQVISLARRRAEPRELSMAQPEIGLLMIEGKLVRHVYCGGLSAAELVGPGDLIRPHHAEQAVPQMQVESSWQVVEAARLAILDFDFAKQAESFPEITCALTGKLIERSRAQLIHRVIVQARRVSERVLKLLWYLANRWGSVSQHGATLQLHCTHTILAELVAATRPSVTLALQELESTGILSRDGSVWFLHQPPARSLSRLT